jgi:hypothetical protein
MEPNEDLRKVRLARNETFFRESNEIRERDAKKHLANTADFICECSSLGCMERLTLTRSEYEHIRQGGDRFAVVPGHEDVALETVVENHQTYLVVEKQGQAGSIARATNPRTRVD